MDKNDYYKAYDSRYKQIHDLGKLWEFEEPTKEVLDFLEDYNKGDSVLELGCGEGRDAINLLNKGYNLLATDYSKEAINKCNELSNNQYIKNFKTLDFLTEELNNKYDYIYSISVLHMLVLKEHRIKYLKFIKDHLKENGKALITVLGDGSFNKCTNIEDAFNIVERKYQNTDEVVNVPETSCNIVGWNTLEEEIKKAGLLLNKKWISKDIPGFNLSMCVIVSKNNNN